MDARWDIVVESFREAQFLVVRWTEAFEAPRMTLAEVADGVEDRLLGACEGVKLGGARTIEALLLPALVGARPSEVTLATIVLAQLRPEAMADAIARVQQHDAFARGLACSDPRIVGRIDALAPAVQAAIVEAYASGSTAPAIPLERRVDITSAAVCRACLRLAARWRPPWAQSWAQWGMQRSDPRTRVLATKLALMLELRGASGAALELAQQGVAGGTELLAMLALRHGERVLPAIVAELRRGRDVSDALVCVGTRTAVDLCVDALDRRTAAAFSTITGIATPVARVDPFVRSLRGSEALLPWPDADVLRRRWASVRGELPKGVRHLGGRPFDEEVLVDALEDGPMRPRRLLALELDLRTRGRVHVDARTWTAIQRAQLRPCVARRAA